MTDNEYFAYIGKNKLWVNWSNFTVQVGGSDNWAYHNRPTHTTEKVTDENGKIVERSRKLREDEVCPVPIYEPEEALRVACQKYIDSLGVKE
jgi:phenylpropionate dioxygenase-like ring-hydroxylating dioxygenase large terminal subunit